MPEKISSFAVSLNVPDPEASARFLIEHLGYAVDMEDDGFFSLRHPDGGSNIIFLRTGLPTFKPAEAAGRAREGLLLVHEVDNLDEAHAQLRDAGAEVVTPPETEPWGERFAQYRDPNGLIIQMVQWVAGPGEGGAVPPELAREELLRLERRLAVEGAPAYRELLHPDAVVIVPGAVLNKGECVAAITAAAPWDTVRMDPFRHWVTADTATLAYRFTGSRGGEEYSAVMLSGYIVRDGRAELIHHQQTPEPG
ncbi:VOC family protein [Arthrobacter zhangbolii]|uniref:VOC family protein n=1 Tax=Arthrobacter zhangbolii TaxID=2886936 RepID=A0A9X1S8H7_9MICC|nr:VOC family protein [Arthrobacter zhangbolii]MCC3271933.1 VOC family protein [Arthrobacter zhangbolii]UON93250.1 VOC family protein [Arthrobacter zhangbolii]